MPRSRRSQSKHNAVVKRIAKEYKDKGYRVKADIGGYGQPETIRGVRPDILAEKGDHKIAVEVETPDSVDSKRDQKQQKAFKEWSQGNQKKHYKKVVTEE